MKPISKSRSAVLIALAILTASQLVAGCNLLPAEEEILQPPVMKPADIEYRTMIAALTNISDDLKLSGRFYPADKKTLTFQEQGGRLMTLDVAQGDQVKAGDLVAELDPGNLKLTITLLQIDIEKSKLTISQLKSVNADTYSLKRAQLDLEQQQLRLANLQKQMDQTIIRTPVDGTVTFVTDAAMGEYIDAGKTIAIVANTSNLSLITSSTDAGLLPIGAKVTVTFNMIPLQGTVVANPSTLYNDPEESLRNAAIITLDGGVPEGAVMNSMAEIVYVKDQRTNVIAVPRGALNSVGSRRYINVLEDNIRVERDVEVGLTTDLEVEILSGIAVGDIIILG